MPHSYFGRYLSVLIPSHLIFNALLNMKLPHQAHIASVFRKKLHVFPESVPQDVGSNDTIA